MIGLPEPPWGWDGLPENLGIGQCWVADGVQSPDLIQAKLGKIQFSCGESDLTLPMRKSSIVFEWSRLTNLTPPVTVL
jgi:hypothetical protein